MGELIRKLDWSRTPVGDFAAWPQSLRTSLGILLDSGYAMYIAWGPEYTQFYNDAYRPILGVTKHPAALGRSTLETFPEIWDFIGPMFRRVMEQGENTTLVDQLLPLNRYGYLEECYFTFSYSAIRNEDSKVGGVLVTCIETTQKVLNDRRLRSLRELAARSSAARGLEEARAHVRETLRVNPFDIPFAELVGRRGLEELGICTPASAEPALIRSLGSHGRVVESPVWPGEAVEEAMLLPLAQAGNAEPEFLFVGISPRRALDADYESFLRLAAQQTAALLENARAHEAELRRLEALAELDRAKMTFFANVSHEFRTPLTLLLAPLEEALSQRELLPAPLRLPLEMAQRNAHRLLKLVNTLLDFSRIEAGKLRARCEPVDLGQLTADIASAFRSTFTAAGLTLEAKCDGLSGPVYVDREMWEKVVLNLISNAFKYTLHGAVKVSLREEHGSVILEVADTGIGIAANELPLIFERFHRVEGAKGRTFEGTGIGLALVSELVRLHDGRIEAESREGEGSLFRVSIPSGGHRASDAVPALPGARISGVASMFVEEAEFWGPRAAVEPLPADQAAHAEGRILFADDNADVRDYVARVLGGRFAVKTVANGEEALAAMPAFQPDVVVSDIMMPQLDGFQLLAAMRADERLRGIPIVLLSARAGEEARIEGLEQGANDYLAKPFSARELLARVSTQLAIGRLRRAERALHDKASEAERRFRDLLVQTPAPMALLRGPEHVFEFANDEYLKLTGRDDPQALLGKRVIDVFPEVEAQGFLRLLDGVYRNSIPYVGREELLSLARPDGATSELYLDFVYQPFKDQNGRTDGVLFHGSDVTELVNARKVLEDSERQLRTLAESIPQLVWTCLPDGRCDYLSKQWVAYTGIPERKQLGLSWLDLVMHPEDRQRTYDAWMAAVEDREPYDIEYRLKRYDGSYRWFKTRGAPVRNAAGVIEKWFGTCTDIEDQKLAERHMLDQQKLESLGLLAGGIAHDFNNLLVGVLGNASLIDDSLPETHPLRPMVHGIVEAGERAAHLTRQMLAYAGKGKMFIEVIDVNSLARSTAGLVEASIPKSVRIILETHSTDLVLEADSGQIQQVIMNLAINGAEAVGSGGSGFVWIRTARVDLDREYLAAHHFVGDPPREGTYACIEIEDTGPGIEPAVLSKIFDPFFTTKFTGRGLGLAAVLGIVRAMHGGIEVRTAPGCGTTFRVLFPAAAGAVPAPAPTPAAIESDPKLPLVLVIDDEAIVRETTRASLRKSGYGVMVAESGEEGVKLFRGRAAEIAMVLLDMSMPGMTGREVLEQIRRSNESLPVLIFSGFSEEQVHQHFAGLRISGFVQKPFTSHNLASAIHAVLSPQPEARPAITRARSG